MKPHCTLDDSYRGILDIEVEGRRMDMVDFEATYGRQELDEFLEELRAKTGMRLHPPPPMLH